MSDYWVSQTRHWCKYCKKFVQNNKPSIQLHESGNAHKAQVERFLRNVYKKGRDDKIQAEKTKLEIERIERAAHTSAGVSYYPNTAMSSRRPESTTTAATTTIQESEPSDPNVPSLEELREQYEEKLRQQLRGNDEWAMKKDLAQVGEWETVVESTPLPPTETEENEKKTKSESTTHDQLPELQDDQEQDEDLHSFKIKEKEYPADLDLEPEQVDSAEEVTFKKRKLDNSGFKSRKKKPLRKKD